MRLYDARRLIIFARAAELGVEILRDCLHRLLALSPNAAGVRRSATLVCAGASLASSLLNFSEEDRFHFFCRTQKPSMRVAIPWRVASPDSSSTSRAASITPMTCLRFYENARAVRTASKQQVRRPIFRDGVDQWRHFEQWLGPLREALDANEPALAGRKSGC
jgi:hypothetical protein